jgi:hypothetical protein
MAKLNQKLHFNSDHKLSLPGRKWMPIVIIRQTNFCRFFEPFRTGLASKFAKGAKTRRIFCKHSIWLSNNAELDADFESDENIAKKFMQKNGP